MDILKTAILTAVVAVSLGFQYPDLVALKDCNAYDSCQQYANLLDKNCKCDSLCPFYADCCLDSEYYLLNDLYKRNIGKYACVALKGIGDVYMKATCKDDWDDPFVSNLCLKGLAVSGLGEKDPMARIPATSMESNITYANYYCAMCNEDSKSLYLWDRGFKCNIKEEEKLSVSKIFNLSDLRNKNGKWGINIDTEIGSEFIDCEIYPVIPKNLTNVARDCTQTIHNCSSDFTDENVEQLCRSYTSVVTNKDNVLYRNVHCAMCNFENANETVCYNPNQPVTRINVGDGAFPLLFDFTDFSGSNIVGSVSTCEETEFWDPFFRKCRSVLCAKPNQVFRFGRCVDTGDFNETLSIDPSLTSSTVAPSTEAPSTEGMDESTKKDMNPILFPTQRNENSTFVVKFPDDRMFTTAPPSPVTGTAVASNATKEFQECHKIFLHNEEFIFNENDTVYVQKYSKVYTPKEYQLGGGGIFVCLPPTDDTDKFSPAIAWVSLVGMGVSCVCLLLHLLAFLMVPDLRNLSGKNLVSLCLALLASYTTFIVSAFTDPNGIDCIILGGAMYYFFLSSSCWMTATAFDIWHTFRLTKTELRVTAGNQWHKFIAYSLYAWLLPAVALIIVVVVDVEQPEGIPEDFLPFLGKNLCWFGHRKALLVFFALPMTILIILNCAFFISTARIIAETTSATSQSTTGSHHKNQYKMHMRLAVLMGFTWLFGILAGYLQVEAVWYIFVLLNTLQGAFLFLAFTCRRKVWRVMGVTSHKMLQRGTSWIGRQFGQSNQAIELKNSTSPSTSIDGL